MRVFSIAETVATEHADLQAAGEAIASAGYLWISLSRDELTAHLPEVQAALVARGNCALLDLHLTDLQNEQLPSHYDYTSQYDVLVMRRLAPADPWHPPPLIRHGAGHATPHDVPAALRNIQTRAVGFAVFDRVLLSVHPQDMAQRDAFAAKLLTANRTAEEGQPPGASMAGSAVVTPDGRSGAHRLPASPADLMLRMVNQIVDGYLDLRRELSQQLDAWQAELVDPRTRFGDWGALMQARQSLHRLDEICEDQRSAMQDWIDAMETLPPGENPKAVREHELLLVRSRDVLEHIERVVHHVRRLQANAETAVQMHFSVQSNRTNDIMRVLTVLTAVFLPLNLIAGVFGMNFEFIPLLHKADGFWIAMGSMVFIALLLLVIFERKRYLDRSGQ